MPESIWDAFRHQVDRFHAGGLDVFFLAFLLRVERFGYFTLGPITIDVRLIEDIVTRTTIPDTKSPPGLGDDMARFSHLLAEEMRSSRSQRPDDLHVLLSLMRCKEGLPSRVFGELGVTPEQVEDFLRNANRPAIAEEKLYSPEDAAEYLGVHVQTVRAWIRSGKLRANRLTGQRALRIRQSDLQSVLEPVNPAEVGES